MKRTLAFLIALSLVASMSPAQATEKREAPAAPVTAKVTIVGTMEVKTIPAMTAILVHEKAADYVPEGGYKAGAEGASQAYERMMAGAFEKLGAWMKAGNHPMGPCFALYYEDPMTTPAKDLTCKVGFPVGKEATGHNPAVIEQLPEQHCAVVQYKGPYEGSAEVWKALDKWILEHQYESAGVPCEVYLKGPADNVTPDEYLTEIRIPVQKRGGREEMEKHGKIEKKDPKTTGK